MTAVSPDANDNDRQGRKALPLARPEFRASQARFGFLLILPALALFVLFILYPFGRSFLFAFFESTLFNPDPRWVGVQNFQELP